MSPGILGKKIGMTQVFRPDGQVVPVTLLKAGPCVVVQKKTPGADGYHAVQLGLMEFVKPRRINRPMFPLDRNMGNPDLSARLIPSSDE